STDPASGKPSISTGIMMSLAAGRTNPIALLHGQELVMWKPATPFVLAANTCYWAVLNREGGGDIGLIGSVTTPTGAAASLELSRSADSGATWQVDDLSNFKMRIQGTPVGSPLPTAQLAADGSTAIPGGTGNFTSLPLAPGLSGNNLVFYGTGSSGQQGI